MNSHGKGYDRDRPADVNIALALFEVAAALRELGFGDREGPGALQRIATEMQDECISSSLDDIARVIRERL